ncbi:MAG: GTP-binding protein [Legionella sp.]|nr:GTP-binding protein [Legionella sp.]
MTATVKLVFFGAEESGKTTLAQYFRDPESLFSQEYTPTVGVDVFNKSYYRESDLKEDYRVSCFDTAGQMRFQSIIATYQKKAQIGVYCVDLSQPLDKDKIDQDIASFKRLAGEHASVIIVGTKSDLPQNDPKAFEALQAQYEESPFFIISVKNKDDKEKKKEIEKFFEKIKELSKHHAFGVAPAPISPIDEALALTHGSLLYDAIDLLKKKMTSLSPKTSESIGQETLSLVRNLQGFNDANEAIKKFETNCYAHLAGKHPVLKAVAKLVAMVAITAFVTVIAALVGFGIGFGISVWMGPGAFISGITMGSATLCMLASLSGVAGLAAGALTTLGLFKVSPIEKAVQEVATCARQQAMSPFILV